MISNRLKQIIDYKKITANSFALKIGISAQSLGNYLNGRIPNVETIEKIISTFREINPEWLLTGNGQMLRNLNESDCNTQQKEIEQLKARILELEEDKRFLKSLIKPN